MFVTLCVRRAKGVAAALALLLLLSFGVAGLTAAARVNEEARQGIPLPVVMYHSIVNEKAQQGKYVISPGLLESDLKYLRERGYTAVVVADLLRYVDEGEPLPEKPVMLTFDDGNYDNYLYAYPLAKKYGMKLVISPVGAFTDKASEREQSLAGYPYLTWAQIREMQDSGLVEFQNHTYNLHGDERSGRLGAQKRRGESAEAYTELLSGDLSRMQREMTANTGCTPVAFVYPYGIVSTESLPVIRELGFQATFTCEDRTNYITQDPDCLFGLGRYLRPAGMTSEKYFSRRLKLE